MDLAIEDKNAEIAERKADRTRQIEEGLQDKIDEDMLNEDLDSESDEDQVKPHEQK